VICLLPYISQDCFSFLEDYEYFYLAKGGYPKVYKKHAVDISVESVVQSMKSWSKNHASKLAYIQYNHTPSTLYERHTQTFVML